MAERPEITRLVLQYYAQQAIAAGQTLGAFLTNAAMALVPGVMAGKIVIEAETAGSMTKYELPPGRLSLTPVEIAAMMSRLVDLYYIAIAPVTTQFATLYGAGLVGGLGPQDAAILAWMLQQLTVIRSFSIDHSQPNIRQ